MKKLAVLLSLMVAWPSVSFAANASPVSINTITKAGNVFTVNTATNHGYSVNQGVCLTTPDVACVVITGGTVNSFTFNLPSNVSLNTCASSCGTVSAAKRSIWLNTATISTGYQVSYVIWLTTQNPVVKSGATSLWTGASTAENAAIASGGFIEMPGSQFFATGAVTTDVETFLLNLYTIQQSQLAASVQPGQFYGNFYDGTGWTQ